MINSVYILAALPNHYLRCIDAYPNEAENPQEARVATFEMYFKDGTADEMAGGPGTYSKTVTRVCVLSLHLPDLELILEHPTLVPYTE